MKPASACGGVGGSVCRWMLLLVVVVVVVVGSTRANVLTPVCTLCNRTRYRTGALKFSDGTADPDTGAHLPLLAEDAGANQCSSEAALGDLKINVADGGGCAGGHAHSFVCSPTAMAKGQNSCCGMGDGSWGKWNTVKFDTYVAH